METYQKSSPKKIIGFVALGILLLGIALANPGLVPEALKHDLQVLEAQIASYDLGSPPFQISTETKTSGADGMTEIYVPGGSFIMGTNEGGFPSSYPEHKVGLDAFWIDQTEISNSMYAKCVQTGECKYTYARTGYNPRFGNPLYANSPVTYVTWFDADHYCRWAGRRLPTEAEWEKAARGTNGQFYPWGSTVPNETLLNFDENIGAPVSVFRYPLGASPYGVLGMEGNVREWVADWFGPRYYSSSPYSNPEGPSKGSKKSLRGGSYLDDARGVLAFIRFQHDPTSAGANRGFRCAEDASE